MPLSFTPIPPPSTYGMFSSAPTVAGQPSSSLYAQRTAAAPGTDVGGQSAYPSMTYGQPMPVRQVLPYDTGRPQLTAADFAELSARRRVVEAKLAEAMARRQAGTGEAQSVYTQMVNRIGREAVGKEHDLRNTLAGKGLGFSPRFMGRGLVELRDWRGEQVGQASSEKASRIAALDEMVRQATSQRDMEQTLIAADDARRRSDLSRLIGMVGA